MFWLRATKVGQQRCQEPNQIVAANSTLSATVGDVVNSVATLPRFAFQGAWDSALWH